jgi:dihydropteroate synthase
MDQTGTLRDAAADPAHVPLVLGVLNVTPDSFSDGGRFRDPAVAIRRGLEMADEGADLVDVGGESTRPGAAPVAVDEELSRVLPVIRALADRVPVSIDTRRAAVAAAALEAGAVVVNDVSGFRFDPEMAPLLGRLRPLAIAMHSRGTPADMAERTDYRSLATDVLSELWAGVAEACDAGLPFENVWLDPGIGFAKDAAQNLRLLADVGVLVRGGRPIVIGVSRKSFLGHVLDRRDPADRAWGTAAAIAVAVAAGARVVRVHDVAAMRDVARVAHAIAAAGGGRRP